jgi:hypothetical protein
MFFYGFDFTFYAFDFNVFSFMSWPLVLVFYAFNVISFKPSSFFDIKHRPGGAGFG